MNYYNPYFYNIPNYAYTMAPKVGLFSRLFGGGKLSLGSILNGTQKTLGFINQAIPVVKQATPIVKNAKTMFRVMNEFKKSDKPRQNTFSRKTNNYINNNVNNENIKTSTDNGNNIKETIETNDQGPTFFI